jgi:NADP-dependent 3-hydroxy acid dehydrogenase YdfG
MGVVYNATKHAVRVISEGLRLELSKSANIRVTNINPGTTTTELLGNTSHEATFNYISQFLGGAQALSADTIGHAVQFVIELPDSTSVNEITIRPTAAPH